jgi:hypothetical protein
MKRSSYLLHDEEVALGKRGLRIWGYGKKGRFACRVEINATGLAVYSGPRGGKRLINSSWEHLVDKLSKLSR